MKRKHRMTGFTLIELMVVVIIVGILAAVALPFMSVYKERAIASEAYAGCGAIQTHLRLLRVEGKVPPADLLVENGVMKTDLNGTFFSASCYDLDFIDPNDWMITVSGQSGTDADGIVVSVNSQGQRTLDLPQ